MVDRKDENNPERRERMTLRKIKKKEREMEKKTHESRF